MQGIHCFSARNDTPIGLCLDDLSGNSPVHLSCDGDGFTFSPTSPDDSRPSSASMSTSTNRSTTSSRGASFLENCTCGLDDSSHGGGGGGVRRSTMHTRYSKPSFISSSFNVKSCILQSISKISDEGVDIYSKASPPRSSVVSSRRVASTMSSKGSVAL